ncbi:MAG: ribose 5-phosphate isomerase B [Opitutales bacterium]|nr:ribose 5-phosphate isomerase B [Opitutales bacterium]
MTSPETKPILIDADDAAYDLKDIIVEHIRSKGHEVIDLKHMQEEETYYPGVAYNLAKKISGGEADKGILICGTGLGMAITANKVKGVFAGTCHDVYSAERLRKSNNANVLTFGARVIGSELAKMVVDAFLESEFAGGGSTVKVEQMRSIDNETLGGCC